MYLVCGNYKQHQSASRLTLLQQYHWWLVLQLPSTKKTKTKQINTQQSLSKSQATKTFCLGAFASVFLGVFASAVLGPSSNSS